MRALSYVLPSPLATAIAWALFFAAHVNINEADCAAP